ncbi:T9SS type A sorting domain-containing protein [Flavobacterium sp. N2820]|uniref:T9SS type A sorting domain-containing protein n=1 Tax=Flavobacterium sp. N2820 TaxID=2986834 RepID=UPI0022251634|nr:T9SS type A sorting domain-containing protein [Flavobacterium sp. N2820]
MKQILQKMKQYALVVLLVLMSNYGWGQISESFESGLPSSYNASLSNVTLNSGTWQVKDVIAGTTGVQTGTKSAQIRSATAAQIITPTISGGVGTVSFYVTASSTSGAYQVNFSTDNGINWTPATGSPFTIGTTKTLRTITINNSNVNKIQIYRTVATIYIDDFVTTTFGPTNIAPTASSVTFSGTTIVGQTLTGTYTYTDADSDLEGTSTFQWYRADNASGLNSAAISGATATTYMLQAADNGKYIRFGVVPVAASGTSPGVEAFSSWQGPVTDPTAVTATLTPSVALTEQNLNVEILTLTLENTIFTDATLDAANFTLNNAPAGVVIDAVAYDTPTTALITLLYDDTDFDASIANFSVTIAASELSAAQNLSSSTVAITAVAETLSVSTITSFGSPCLNSETTQTFTVSGSNLKVGNVSLAALSGFTYSLDNTNFTPTLTIASAGGTLAATTIHVKFVPTAVQTYDGNIVVSGVGAASLNRSVVANGVNTVPTLTTPASTSITVSSAVLGGNLTGVGCTSVTTRGIEYSTTPGFSNGSGTVVSESGTFSTGTFTVNVTGLTSGTTYYYKAFATSASGTSYTTEASFSTLAIAAPLALNATGVGATSFTATWDAVLGATSYEIDVYEGGVIANQDIAVWTFPISGTTVTPDIASSNNTTKNLTTNGGTITSLAGASTQSASANSWLSGSDLKFWQIELNATGFSNIKLSSKQQSSGTGPRDFKVQYNIGSGWVDVSGGAITVANNFTTGVVTDLSLPSVCNNQSNLLIRWIMTSNTSVGNGTVSGGSSRIDDIYVVGDLSSLVFVSGYNALNVGNVTSYPITGLDQNTAYYYVVRALDATSESVNSNEITTTTALVSTTWNGTTWSNGAPTSTVDAIIDGDFSSTGTLIAKDVTINATRTLTINAADQLSVMGNLVNNGAILFKSDATSTGRFDSYTGSAITGSGTVTMERYIDGKRAYRLLAPGVTTTGTIANNWQQQVFITGSTTGANGFDATTTGNPSMYTYENSGWAPISNTNVLTLDATKGYRMLIRGDRTPSLLTNPSEANMNTPVTLTATGSLVTGDVTFTTLPSQDYTLVGNPYVSPIDWATVTKNDIAPTYYVWDPNLGTVGQRGRYVSCDEAGLTSIVSGSGGPSSAVNAFIQPGQAFFIEKAISGAPGSITVKETDKAATFTDVFRTNSAPTITTIEGKLGMNLYESLAYSLGDYPIDGAVAVSGTAFNTASANDDAKKLMSHGEQVAFVRENKQLGVEKVSPPQLNDVLTLATLNLVPNKNYVWSVVLQDNFSSENSYLYDAFTQTYHSLTASGTTVVSFATTADVTSTQANRFKIVFQTSVLSAPDFTNEIVVYPNPAKAQNAVCYVKGISNATVALHNVLGQNIPIQTTTDGTTLTLRPTVALNKGIYVVHIAQDSTIKQVKWIVD